LPELRVNFHDHVVLIERSKNGRDLPLGERVVERVVEQLCGDAQTRGCLPVVGKPRL
jgi:hypothetical protein